MVTLKKGQNSIQVNAVLGTERMSKTVLVTYRPPLIITINNANDNMEVSSLEFELDIDVSEGAQFSVNGITGNTSVTLKPGPNVIVVKAWDTYGSTAEKTITLVGRTDVKADLFISSPTDKAVVESPQILVTGTATAGASVTVNGANVQVSSSGSFVYSLNLPDEAGEYTVSIIADINGESVTAERTVVYKPVRPPLTLVIASPAGGQKINQKLINAGGRTTAGAAVMVNNVPVKVSTSGAFSTDITVGESNIGTYSIEFSASDDENEIVKSVDVQVSISSPQINTSKPVIQAQGQLSGASRNGKITVIAIDRTPGEDITLSVSNSGSRDEYTIESGQSQVVDLEEGKNNLVISAKDLAGNASNTITGSVYFLPGPIKIRMIQPSGTVHVIKGLPPMPGHAGSIDKPRLDIEVEIDDGIGSVPETVKYCRIQGSGATVYLSDNKDYSFTGEVVIERGKSNVFTITAEDLAGNTQTSTLTVQVSR
jgi:hypothetical protein